MTFKFDYHIPPPKTNQSMVERLKRMSINASFLDEEKQNPINWRYTARRLGMKLTCELQPNGLYRIWRIE